MTVNIYIESSCKGPRQLNTVGIYVMEALEDDGKPLMVNGEPWVKTKKEVFESVNDNVITMKLLIEALKRMKKPSVIRVFTSNDHVFYTLENGWNIQWKKNGWRNARNMQIKHPELWAELTEELQKHSYSVTKEGHSYLKWMEEQVKNGGNEYV